MNTQYSGAWMVTLGILLALVALSGCISPENLMMEPGKGSGGTPVPTSDSATHPGEIQGTGEIITEAPISQGAQQYYVKTPYGYILTTPRTGVRLAIIEIKEDVDASGQEYLTGKVRNEENFRINHITLNFNLFNSNGNLIGNAYASVNALDPGKVWMFTTNSFPAKDYHYYQMAEAFTV